MQNLVFYKNRTLVALLICLTLSLSMMFLNDNFTSLKIRDVFFVITYPVQYSLSAVGRFFIYSVTSIARIQQLETELAETRQRLLRFQESSLLYSQITNENNTLRNALQIKPNIPLTTHYARVVFRDPNLTGDYFIIDKGSLEGIRLDMPVVSYTPEGEIYLVGRTREVNLTASKVQLITAGDSFVGVTLKNSGYVGILKGFGSWNQNCVVEYIPIEANAYVGEDVITSGESDVFPPNLTIGKIVGMGRVTSEDFFKKLYVKPLYNYSKIRDVFLIDWKSGVEVQELIQKTGEK